MTQVDILTVHHISVDTFHSLAVTGLHLIDPISSSPLVCDSCDYGKATRKPVRKEIPERDGMTPLSSTILPLQPS
jgi:hypothetical protein